MNLGNFYDGKEFETYRFLGAHVKNGGVMFRTYAPAALRVCVIGEFNHWTDTPMHRVENGQFWEVFIADAKPGQMYKYRIYKQDNSFMDHADPYAFSSELRPGTASVIADLEKYHFHDSRWMQKRTDNKNKPLNIYELHLGSWRRKDDPKEHIRKLEEAKEKGEGIDVSGGWYRYEEIGDLLIPYLKENHFNSVEIMPLNEYPSDESWGYQALGFFSATSRYGQPDGLQKLVDQLHAANISVILDVVTVHFAVNDFGLWEYDGTHLYEYPNQAVSHSEWGSCNFSHSRGDVRSFLNSASDFWISMYHFDGLRFDAVGNLIYWQGDQGRGVNTNTIEFIRSMNDGLKQRHPQVMLIAEDSSAYPGVTKPVSEGGLGFDYKWDMGWMNDTLNYFRTDPPYRPENYHKLTFSMQYFYNENYLLPLSHDEVVHGKATIIQKMAGDYEKKFPQARALYTYMFAHPGKKLNFMGNEIGQFREWDEKREQDWDILHFPVQDAFHHFFMDLCKAYEDHSALWEMDYSRNGFEWLEADAVRTCVYVFRRMSSAEVMLCLFNFSDRPQVYTYPGRGKETLELVMDSDDRCYGGSTASPVKKIRVTDSGCTFELPAFSGRCYTQKKTE